MTSPASSLIVDLRSDTVTRPSAQMRQAMADAVVGDVCWGDDPTVARLEAIAAERLGKEAAIFVPTGTMGNQVALAVLTSPGDVVVCERRAHIARWEGAAAAVVSGLQLLDVEAPERGLLTPDIVEERAFPDHPKAPRIAAVALENTHNGAGGAAHSVAQLAAITGWARARGASIHIDGARLFNASVALGVAVEELAGVGDTVSVCFSKGLGAPIGSVVAGSVPLIEEADRVRHRMGGGWRQAGIVAAGALFALERQVSRLAEDHRRAAELAGVFEQTGIARPRHRVETNLVYLRVDPTWGTAVQLEAALAPSGVLIGVTGNQEVRIVTHLDIDDAGLEHALKAIQRLS